MMLKLDCDLSRSIQPRLDVLFARDHRHRPFTRADADSSTYLHIHLWNTGVSNFQISSQGERPLESISLNYTKIEVANTTVAADGVASTPYRKTYDLMLQKST